MSAQEEPKTNKDAGMRSLNHYKYLLPKWRYNVRNFLIPIVRWETPYLALMQAKLRTSALDSYFAFTANLGTHTFFMIILPILFWCGYVNLGRAMTHMLASGVFLSGFFKDLLCLPRPLSPPLQRISRSASVALEYGFPSTHSTNAVSVAVYSIVTLTTSTSPSLQGMRPLLLGISYFYAISITIGRMYCGMHGFFDVIIGSILGALLAFVQCFYGPNFNDWVFYGPFRNIIVITLVILVLIRVHPEPADDCPCFDDSVAFAGVMIGIQLGGWHYARTSFSWDYPMPSTAPFNIDELGWFKACLRILLGVVIIFAWRGIMKPSLLKVLPPIFRIIEKLGLSLPRKFFLRASQYKTVPPLRKDDNLIPPASEIPQLITSLRHPRRRAVSIGPQSEADAYEALAFRERRRRESISSLERSKSRSPSSPKTPQIPDGYLAKTNMKPAEQIESTQSAVTAHSVPSLQRSIADPATKLPSDVAVTDSPVISPRDGGVTAPLADGQVDILEDDVDDREIFLRLQKPRVRYDVEVVTKLIVYTGIAWLAVEGNPILFELCGLGLLGRAG